MLSAMPMAAKAQEGEGLRTKDVSIYPTVSVGGGFHWLYFDEFEVDENGESIKQLAFDPGSIGELAMGVLDRALDALKKLDLNGVVDIVIEAAQEWLGPIQMNNDGESIADNISFEVSNRDEWLLYGEPDWFQFNFDWRLDPVENARRLNELLERLEETRPQTEKYNFLVCSGSGPIILSYLKHFDPELKRVASLVLDVSMHNGTSMYGEIAKRKLMLDTEALGKLNLEAIVFGGGTLDLGGIPPLQPLLRIIYEIGLMEIPERVGKLLTRSITDRAYDEVIVPYLFTMPAYWAYVPHADYAEAKRALLSDPKYAGLVAKLDYYRSTVMANADDIILAAAEKIKVAVRAGYGFPMWPLGKGTGAQSDGTVDTVYASLGATCAPLDRTFAPWHEQKDCKGHNHISPDRMIDASTCLLPDQTWFAKNKPHGTENSYSGWYEWFKAAEFLPTVFNEDGFPQFVETLETAIQEINDLKGTYVPLLATEDEAAWIWALKAVGLWILKIWRWLLRLPLFWV